MKNLLFTGLLISLLAHSHSINPEKTTTPFLDLYSPWNKTLDDGQHEIQVSTYNKAGYLTKNGDKIKISSEKLTKMKAEAEAVYETGSVKILSTNSDDRPVYYGSAFHIGDSFVLTGQHVLSPSRENTQDCDQFKIKNDALKESYFECKQVHYCHKALDLCLIEMAPLKKCKNFFCTKYDLDPLASRPALKIANNYEFSTTDPVASITSAIGNPQGLGIHYSQGSHQGETNNEVKFFAPVRGGSSGGALVNHEGVAVGIIIRVSAVGVGKDSYNVALTTKAAIAAIRQYLGTKDPETLQRFEKTIIDYQNSSSVKK